MKRQVWVNRLSNRWYEPQTEQSFVPPSLASRGAARQAALREAGEALRRAAIRPRIAETHRLGGPVVLFLAGFLQAGLGAFACLWALAAWWNANVPLPAEGTMLAAGAVVAAAGSLTAYAGAVAAAKASADRL